jgi:hypothetical protein
MLLTIAFATSFDFVSWTIPSSAVTDVCHLVSTPARQLSEIGSGLPFQASPNLTDYHLKIAFQAALQDHSCYANGYE